jgi:hypothetical protein
LIPKNISFVEERSLDKGFSVDNGAKKYNISVSDVLWEYTSRLS